MDSANSPHTALLVKKLLGLVHTGKHDDFRNVITALSSALLVYFIGVAIYRVTLHPLAKYPGPFLRKISGWPDGISARSGKKHIDEYRLHLTYGDVVRTGPNTLSFSSAKAFQDLHGDRNANVIKSGTMGFNRDTIPTHSMIVMDNKQEHSARRRLVSHAFSEKALSESEKLMIEKIDQWTESLYPPTAEKQTEWSAPKNMSDSCNLLALDVISKLCLGQDYGAIKAGHTPVHSTLIRNSKFVQYWAYSPLLPFVKPLIRNVKLLKLLAPGMYKQRWSFRLMTLQMLRKRAELEEEARESGIETQKDFFHYIFKAKDPITGERPPYKQFDAEASLLIAAGSDTTSTALSSLLFYLNHNPETKAKLQAEIRAAFDDVDEIRTGSQLASLTYLRACIDEALRMNPPVPSGLTREVCRNGMTIDGEFVPEGTVVNVALYGLHREGRYFPEPHKFIPERWIEGSVLPGFTVTEDFLKTARNAWNPFSAGMRRCAGINMAYQEMSIAMARLIFLYDMRFSTAPGAVTGAGSPENKIPGLETSDEFTYEDFFITTKTGPFLEYKKVDEVAN